MKTNESHPNTSLIWSDSFQNEVLCSPIRLVSPTSNVYNSRFIDKWNDIVIDWRKYVLPYKNMIVVKMSTSCYLCVGHMNIYLFNQNKCVSMKKKPLAPHRARVKNRNDKIHGQQIN